MARGLQRAPTAQLACRAHAGGVREKADSDIFGGLNRGGTSVERPSRTCGRSNARGSPGCGRPGPRFAVVAGELGEVEERRHSLPQVADGSPEGVEAGAELGQDLGVDVPLLGPEVPRAVVRMSPAAWNLNA